jgi:hypothetical protein
MDSDVRVELFGRRLVWLKNPDGSGPLAYPEHMDESGELKLAHAMVSLSYAHVFADGTIRRFNKVIGTVADLVVVSDG